MINYEFDLNKSHSNFEKHGIDFIQAQALWDDEDLLEIKAKIKGELRHLVIGKIKQQYWSAVITYRPERIRIISVRRSRIKEIKLYES